jgi:hypothetical protein
VTQLENEVLETLNREFLKRVMTKVLQRLKDEVPLEERLKLINAVDENGATLLHYVTALNYYELIQLL